MPTASPPDRSATVPPELVGCWRRSWIEYADGRRDDTSIAIWLQLDRDMADLRVPPDRGTVTERRGFEECSHDELRALTASESSSGITTCPTVEIGADGVRRLTAAWSDGDDGVAFQPVTAFPEPGLLEWVTDDAMIERAPSGAYVEEWRLMPGTRSPLDHHVRADGAHVYRAGDAVIVVRDRPTRITEVARLDELARCGDDRDRLIALVDCEFSFATRLGDRFVVEASTLPWREGTVVDVGLR